MTLRKRLGRLEAQRLGRTEGPRVMIFNVCWRDDVGHLQSIAKFAQVLTASGWQTMNRDDNEPEANFLLRAEALAA